MSAADTTSHPQPPQRNSGIDVKTLIIASLSSVAAAILVSRIWGAGTIAAAAVTPVIVALTKEALERPADRLSDISTRRRVVVDHDDLVVEEVEPQTGEAEAYRVYGVRPKHWKIAAITGLLAFLVAAAALTLPELVTGRSVGGGDRGTTIWGGSGGEKKSSSSKTTSTATEPAQTTPTVTETVTTPTPTTTTPTTETPPAQTTTTPPATTVPAP